MTTRERRAYGRAIRGPLVLALAVTVALPSAASAFQLIRGQVLDEVRETGISDALVQLTTRDGDTVEQTLSDGFGRFVVTPPRVGEYYLVVEALGYFRTTTPLLALSTEGTANLDITLQPQPIGLEGLAVTVDVESEAGDELRLAGIEPRDLGNGWITEARIDAIAVKRDIGNLLEWAGTPTVRVVRSENNTKGEGGEGDDTGMCFSFARARTFHGVNRCALIILDGRRLTGTEAQYLDPNTIGQAAVLQPIDARIMYGTPGDAGVVIFWTKRGRAGR